MFLCREHELRVLNRGYQSEACEFVVIYGRKRVGKTALIENFFDRSAYLFEEPENLLRQELREPAIYNSIITAIAESASKASEIASKVHLARSACNKYLKVLMELGIVQKIEPIMNNSKKKTSIGSQILSSVSGIGMCRQT